MATRAQIIELRIRIADPAGVIGIIDVADPSTLPAVPAQQTAYYVTSTGFYMTCELLSGATPGDYVQAPLRISDTYLAAMIDSVGLARAICNSFAMIKTQLGNQLVLVKNTSGAESAEYTKLLEMYSYYKQLERDCKDSNDETNLNSTGRMYKSQQPEIAGGNL